MAQFQEFTFDQGADTSIELHLVDKNGAAKNRAVTVDNDNFSKLIKNIKNPKCISTHLINVNFG